MMMITRCFLVALSISMISGCSPAEYPPISMDAVKGIRSGTPLEDVVKILGEPHSPTPVQASHLEEVIAKMPEAVRANAQKDQSHAWGNDRGFLVVKVNDQGIVWVTASRSS